MIKELINNKRAVLLKAGENKLGPVVYWMSREQRVADNWALIFAQDYAIKAQRELIVVFCISEIVPNATARSYTFLIDGLREIPANLAFFNIPFQLLKGNPEKEIPIFLKRINASVLVTDFDPLKYKRKWKELIAEQIKIPFYEVDSHNIVPYCAASDKLEFSAATIRRKITNQLEKYLVEFPILLIHERNTPVLLKMFDAKFDNIVFYKNLKPDKVDWIKSGEINAMLELKNFIKTKLNNYSEKRNNPNLDAQSNLSPFLHFGQISAQRIALEVQHSDAPEVDKDAFLEELIIRKELADNFCYYNPNYDNFDGFHQWAKTTLDEHRNDEREYSYPVETFEFAKTHDPAWNAAQNELLSTGKMHGYMRMYWAKKILEWTPEPEIAMEIAIYLNDKYELDGRDPNGYAGIAWSIGGVHDRAWGERAVFGKVRYMNYDGLKRKFDIKSYEQKFNLNSPKEASLF